MNNYNSIKRHSYNKTNLFVNCKTFWLYIYLLLLNYDRYINYFRFLIGIYTFV